MDGAMPATPSLPRSSADPAPVPLGPTRLTAQTPGVTAAPSPEPERVWPFPIRTALLGLAGMVLIAGGGMGAGATLIHDPVLANGAFNWIRYGHGMMLATWLLYLGLGLAIWAWIRLGRHARAGRVNHAYMIRVIVIWIAPLMIAPPLFTRDVYSYLAQGDLALHGLDPYGVGPSALPSALSDNVSIVWQNTPSPYGPLFVLLTKGIVAITGDGLTSLISGVLLMRLVLAVGFAMLWWALPRLCDRLGGNSSIALWLVGANPLLVVHLIGGAHNDMLMIGLMAVGVVLVLDRRHLAGIALVALAFSVKATAAIALPFLIWIWMAHIPLGTRSYRFVRAAFPAVGLFGGIFVLCTLAAGVDLGWIPALSGSSIVINWLSLPSGVGQAVYTVLDWFVGVGEVQPFVTVTRTLGSLLLVYILVRQWWLAREGGHDAIRRAAICMAAFALLAPVTLPWYFSWALVLAAGFAWGTASLTLAACGSVWLLLITYPSGGTALYDWGYMVVIVGVSVLAAVSLLKPDPLNLSLRFIRDAPEKALRHHP
ncbi:polyprenol phosphomannose-dependent alpha 1,6 mannosyltransferase MptB [Kutzneria chonburiensis]|uniref:Polyprenol phosphomannose-dependent alpha 1,6 mannosyltransferase MptB n=1 Tax=Kutzneria chonburiensis TaxID=1483604 RepID=A0ABV6MIT2_9PSEU|nr:polyprenol phosphomannose-dependent alpha 1,6 mannosyltransferase MptB [Kutzneria chonburiensis]